METEQKKEEVTAPVENNVDIFEQAKLELEVKKKELESIDAQVSKKIAELKKAAAVIEVSGRSVATKEMSPQEQMKEDIRKIWPKDCLPKNLQ